MAAGRRWGLALALCLAGQTGQAQTTPDGPLAFRSPILTLSQDRLFTEARIGRAVQERYDTDSRALVAENRRIEAALEQEEQDLTARRATLPPAEFQALAAAFDAKVEDIRTAQDAKSRALTRTRDEERQRLFQTAAPILVEMMTEMGAVAVVDQAAIVLSFDRIDITDLAIARLDARLGDGTAPVPPAPPAEPAGP